MKKIIKAYGRIRFEDGYIIEFDSDPVKLALCAYRKFSKLNPVVDVGDKDLYVEFEDGESIILTDAESVNEFFLKMLAVLS